ncbi:probable gluconokinase [Dysidea avara]|uniref:probable gluconokinase n=1 Tax=Dysidea avara TaxID=196820 RepID=UPI0033210BCE
MIIILFGVCGCGKTATGLSLSSKLHWRFEDADKYHPESNISKMARGEPLTDEDRWPWLRLLHIMLAKWHGDNQDGILACSALKKSYRRVLLTGNQSGNGNSLDQHCKLVFLHGSADVIASRLDARSGHFMPTSLLESQLTVLELPDKEENVLQCDITESTDQIVIHIINSLNLT